MDVEKDGFCKPGSPEKRLRLRKNYKESIDNKIHLPDNSNNESKKDTKNGTACTSSQSSCVDDSILDFKSPKRICSMQSKIVNCNKPQDKSKERTKRKVLHSKPNIINNERKSKGKKSTQSKKIIHDIQQPLIESSFFKSERKEMDSPQSSTDVKTAYVCPLCYKNLKDESSQAVHMKSCATKNNVSTKKLMDAVELQERQAAERKSLGLLSAPILQDKKKPAPRKMASHDDPDLQLALALSKSLYEKEEMEECAWDDVQIVAISSNPSVPDNNAECPQKVTLQSFGFSSSRDTLPTDSRPASKTKKRKPTEPTVLQRRTAAERERILTERIAEILMGCKDFTQRLREEVEESNNVKEKIVITSQLLQQLHRNENTLWDRTKLTLTQNAFYVEQLSLQITPLEKKEQKLNKEQNVMKLVDLNVNNERSLDSVQMQEIKEIQTVKADIDEALTVFSSTVNTCCKEKKFLDDLATSWRNMLNDSSASDIIVFVRNDRHVWTHKLVFYTRCTNILLDVIPNDTDFSTAKEKIYWIDTDYDTALAFLEFVYCGVIDRHSKILESETSLSGVRALGRRYKVNDLFAYLRQKGSKPNAAEVKRDCNTREKSTENVQPNVESSSNVSKPSFDVLSDCTHDVVENVQKLSQKPLLQRDVNDDLHPLEDSYMSAKDSCVLQDEKIASMKLSDEINPRSNTPAQRETSASPDMFDDTPVTKRNRDDDDESKQDKSAVHSEDHGDSDIHILLSLIKQDADIDISSQRSSTAKTQNAEYSEVDKDVSICSNNVESNVMEIDSDSGSNSSKLPFSNTFKDSLSDTPQSGKSKYTQDRPSDITKQKSDLSLFIERVQKENAKLDLDSDSDVECPVQISPVRHKNPFHIGKHDSSEDLQPYDKDVEQSADTEERPGRLTIIEQRMRSYAAKNPEFYSRPSDEHVKQTNISHMDSTSSKETMVSPRNNVLNYTESFTSAEKDVNISEEVETAPAIYSQHAETTNRSFSETVFDLETNEEEISMYSKYTRSHKDNSIAKYRAAISRNRSDGDLSNKSTPSDSISEDSEAEKDEILTQSVLTQKDADVIVSSDTEIESISSNASHAVLENDDCSRKTIMSHSLQQSRKEAEASKPDKENENGSRSREVENFEKTITTNLEEEGDINGATESNRDNLNTTEMTFMTQRSRLNESNDDRKKESIPSPIMVSSSPDFSNDESCSSIPNMESFLQDEYSTEKVLETDAHKSRKSARFSLNFEDDIHLANVDIDKYEKHVLEKSQSAKTLNVMEFKNVSTRRYNNKNIKVNDIMINNVAPGCENLDNAVSSSQNSASIRKFKRKSLSEGQIDVNRLRNQAAARVSVQFQCNYTQNIGNAKEPKITDKDVTPPPDYNGMGTPELHREMKKYGLKVQKRGRAVKLLAHIYNELHPLVPVSEKTTGQRSAEISSDDDEGPPSKKRNTDDNSLEKTSDAEESGNELPCSQDSNGSISSTQRTINREMEFYETESLSALENSSDVAEAFTKLINIDKDLHNKILRYEPVNIESLRSTLRTHGFKCKLSNLMSFLDEQSITFYAPEQSVKSRTRRKA